MTTAILEKENNILQNINLIKEQTVFEYDEEVWEFCSYFKNIPGYFWQWKTKTESLLELLSSYLDTKDL